MLDITDKLINQSIEQSYFEGADVYIEQRGNVIYHKIFGKASTKPFPRTLEKNMIFDLASITKIFTSTLILKLIEEKKCSLESNLCDYYKKLSHITDKITIKHLLTHTSGLPAWYPFYAKKYKKEGFVDDLLDILAPLTIIPNEKVEYSDINFILLGKIVEKIEGKPLDVVIKKKLALPLNMSTLQYNPNQHFKDNIVSTEFGNKIEKKMVRDRKLYFKGWREDVICGQVNDGNTFYYLNGISGHAGLFSNIYDVAKLARVYLDSSYLSKDLIRLSYKNYTSEGAQGRGLGWVVDSNLQGFGHTGFTGTSLWIVPEKEIIMILLTNRLHQNDVMNINPVRKEFYQLVLDKLK